MDSKVEIVIPFGFAIFFLASTGVGIRLLLLSHRTRQVPELMIATGILGIGPCGFAFGVFALLLLQSHPFWSQALWGSAIIAMNIGATAVAAFTWYVFRRQQSRAKLAVQLAGGLCVVATVGSFLDTQFVMSPDGIHGISTELAGWLRIVILGWAALESFRYWGLMGKRVKLGLSDPVVRNRFFLWSFGIGAAASGSFIGQAAQRLYGMSTLESSWLLLNSSLHGLTASVLMWLAFIPPKRYIEWIGVRAKR